MDATRAPYPPTRAVALARTSFPAAIPVRNLTARVPCFDTPWQFGANPRPTAIGRVGFASPHEPRYENC
jgi:hypothetical protein